MREGLRFRAGGRTRAQVLMTANTPMLLRAGLVDGDPAAGVPASGQVVGLLRELPPVTGLIEGIVAGPESILHRLGGGRCA